MSTEPTERELGDPLPSTEYSDNADAIGTPAAAIETKAAPAEVDVSVDAVAEGMVALRLRSAAVEGKIMLEDEPARALAADLVEAADAAEDWGVDQ